jgi:hypothetical protein
MKRTRQKEDRSAESEKVISDFRSLLEEIPKIWEEEGGGAYHERRYLATAFSKVVMGRRASWG